MPVIPRLADFSIPPPAATYPVRTVAGIDVVDLRGGLFVMGGPVDTDAPAHWVQVDRFSMGRTQVTETQSASIDETKKVTRPFHPVVEVSALEAEWEYAARGEVVNLREIMETEGIKEADFADWAKGRFENLFAHCLGSTIYADPTREDFQEVLYSAARIYGYCVYGHPEGLDGGKVWYNNGCVTSVANEDAETRVNSFNLIDMIGNVWEWVADRYDASAYHTLSPVNPVNMTSGKNRVFRGGSGIISFPGLMRASCRGSYRPNSRNDVLGFRLALRASQDS